MYRFCYLIQDWWEKLTEARDQLENVIVTFSNAQEKRLSLKEKLIREEIVLQEKGRVSVGSMSTYIDQLL